MQDHILSTLGDALIGKPLCKLVILKYMNFGPLNLFFEGDRKNAFRIISYVSVWPSLEKEAMIFFFWQL